MRAADDRTRGQSLNRRESLATAPRPLWFGPQASPLFGWLHPAAVDARPLGVLLCAPLGNEDLATHRSLRRLALGLASVGLPVLRFDYAGCGDSAGGAGGEGSLTALTESLQQAADALKAGAGVRHVALVGVRMGALLAALAAQRRNDVAALVALLPVASGRAWLRESRLLAGSTSPTVPSGAGTPATDLGGLLLDAVGTAALGALRWPAAVVAAQGLLVDRDDLPGGAAAPMRACVGRLDELQLPGLSQVTAVAHSATTPQAVWDRIEAWLLLRSDEVEALSEPDAAPAPRHSLQAHAGFTGAQSIVSERAAESPPDLITEQAVSVGDAPRLLAVLTRSGSAAPSDPPRRGLLLLSSGAERRIGPNRLWVPFARQRAAIGDVVLRLDLAGIGDSESRPGGKEHDVYDPRCVEDIAVALAWLRSEHGVAECVVAGVCSGAYHAWRAMVHGLPIAQAVVINPLVFHWKTGMALDPTTHAFGQYAIASGAARSLADPRRWLKLLRGEVDLPVILGAVAARARTVISNGARTLCRLTGWPLEDDLAGELRVAAGDGRRLAFVFAQGDPGLTLLQEGAGRTLTRLLREGAVSLRTVAGADHTFTSRAAREALYRSLNELLERTGAPSRHNGGRQ